MAINDPTNVRISLCLTSTISSGTKKISAPNFLAIEMASFAFILLSSSVLPWLTKP